eukprot:3110520-Prymnesium_polylepis.1
MSSGPMGSSGEHSFAHHQPSNTYGKGPNVNLEWAVGTVLRVLGELACPSWTARHGWSVSNGHTGCVLCTRPNGLRRAPVASVAVPDHILGSNVMIKDSSW